MLGNTDAAANIAVRDLERANNFIDTLGLTPVGAEGQEVVVFESGKKANVYLSQYI
jgi:hypothetical protein